jgi:1-acyl-sn-glycerol-3-phosphate acyltransferase
MGAHIKVTGKEKLKGRKGPFVIINNHLSDFDQFVVISRFRGYPLICVSKPENFAIPVAGPWMAYAGYLAINREDAFEAVKTIKQAANIVSSGQASIGISPEGTRSKDHQIHEIRRLVSALVLADPTLSNRYCHDSPYLLNAVSVPSALPFKVFA